MRLVAPTQTMVHTRMKDIADLVDQVTAVSLDIAEICRDHSLRLTPNAQQALHDANELVHCVISELIDIVHGSDEIAPVHDVHAAPARRTG